METKKNESMEQGSPLDVVKDFTSGDTFSPVVSMENTFLDKKLSICSIAVELREIHVDSCIFDDFDLMDNHGS